MTYTKGEWQIIKIINESKGLRFYELIVKQSNGITRIGDMNLIRADDEADSNARLIAAAPDLLAVCKQIANLAHPSREGFDSASNLLYADDLAQELLEAINKAEGES